MNNEPKNTQRTFHPKEIFLDYQIDYPTMWHFGTEVDEITDPHQVLIFLFVFHENTYFSSHVHTEVEVYTKETKACFILVTINPSATWDQLTYTRYRIFTNNIFIWYSYFMLKITEPQVFVWETKIFGKLCCRI